MPQKIENPNRSRRLYASKFDEVLEEMKSLSMKDLKARTLLNMLKPQKHGETFSVKATSCKESPCTYTWGMSDIIVRSKSNLKSDQS